MSAKRKRSGKSRRARDERMKRSPFGGTLPRSPARIEALLERYSRVKRMLVEYLRARCWDDIRERAARFRDPGADADINLIRATEEVLHGWPRDAGDEPHIIDMFLADQPALNAADRRMVRQWKDVRTGVFRIDHRKERRVRMRNLVDDLDYQTLISGGAHDDLELFAPGVILSAVIAPLMDAWTLSGTQTIFGAIDARMAYGLAAKMAIKCPADFFRNPKHLERSRELGRRYHERFVNSFGQSWVVGTPQEIEDLHRELIAENNRLAAAANEAPSAMRRVLGDPRFDWRRDAGRFFAQAQAESLRATAAAELPRAQHGDDRGSALCRSAGQRQALNLLFEPRPDRLTASTHLCGWSDLPGGRRPDLARGSHYHTSRNGTGARRSSRQAPACLRRLAAVDVPEKLRARILREGSTCTNCRRHLQAPSPRRLRPPLLPAAARREVSPSTGGCPREPNSHAHGPRKRSRSKS